MLGLSHTVGLVGRIKHRDTWFIRVLEDVVLLHHKASVPDDLLHLVDIPDGVSTPVLDIDHGVLLLSLSECLLSTSTSSPLNGGMQYISFGMSLTVESSQSVLLALLFHLEFNLLLVLVDSCHLDDRDLL